MCVILVRFIDFNQLSSIHETKGKSENIDAQKVDHDRKLEKSEINMLLIKLSLLLSMKFNIFQEKLECLQIKKKNPHSWR